MSLSRYPKYKDSGVEWLGEVPEHWYVTRLKRVASVFPSNVDKKSYEGESSVKLCNYTDVYYHDAITETLEFMDATASTEQIAKFSLRGGDTILTKDSETADDIAISAYVPRDLPGVVCGYHLSMVRPFENTHGAFIKWLFDSHCIKAQAEVSANGLTRVGLGQYSLDNIALALPLPEEQSFIEKFLDRETGKIDALVEEQRRLIELLREKRQAVISHAVTKGLNSDAPMKDSGIEWLGDVPVHWTITRLGYYAAVENGSTPSREIADYWIDGTVPWLASGEVNQNEVTEATEFITESALKNSSLRLLPEGTVLVGLVGQGKTRGMSAILRIPATINQNLAAICPGSRLSGDYLLNVFKAAYNSLREDGRGGNQAAMNCQMLSALRVPVPPIEEQRRVAAFISSASAQIQTLECDAERAINLLQERRSALISAAVTGKIDMRDLVAEDAA